MGLSHHRSFSVLRPWHLAAATLTLAGTHALAAPVILAQPLSLLTAQPGHFVRMEVVARGLGELEYLWFKDGEPIQPGKAKFLIRNLDATSTGVYHVMVIDPEDGETAESLAFRVELARPGAPGYSATAAAGAWEGSVWQKRAACYDQIIEKARIMSEAKSGPLRLPLAAWPAGMGHPWSASAEAKDGRHTLSGTKAKAAAEGKGGSWAPAGHWTGGAGAASAGSTGIGLSLLPTGPAGEGAHEDDGMPGLLDLDESPA